MKTTPEDLDAAMRASSPLIIDVLPGDAFAERRISGAKNACVYEVAFLETIAELTGSDTAREIVVYDETGERETALLAAEQLRKAGYGNTSILEGGMRAWRAAEFPVESETDNPRGIADGTYALDLKASAIDWTGRNLANKHWGALRLSSGEITVTDGVLSSGRAVIDMRSMTCADLTDPEANAGLIAHLKSPDFFEVDTWPEAILEITEVTPIDAVSEGLPNTRIAAQLTLHGVTAPVEFPCLSGRGMDGELVAQATFEIDRTAWNVRYGSGRFFEWLGQHLVSDLISLQVKMVVSSDHLQA